MKNLNNWIALKLSSGLSTMAFFWFCFILDVIELPPVVASHSVITYVSYLSQTVIQLLALPLLAVQQKILNENHKVLVKHLKKIHNDVKGKRDE